jgi:hypothetical protein
MDPFLMKVVGLFNNLTSFFSIMAHKKCQNFSGITDWTTDKKPSSTLVAKDAPYCESCYMTEKISSLPQK